MRNGRDGERRPLIQVVDDDPDLRRLLHSFLGTFGYDVVATDAGERALADFALHRPDLVLMDANLPGMDGFTACREILRRYPELRVPIVMVTGRQDEQAVDQAFAAGAEDYVTKPIHWSVLRQRLRLILERQQAVARLREEAERFRMVAESALDAILVTDDQGLVLYGNQAVATIFGYDHAELLGQPLTVLIPPRWHQGHLAGMQRVREEGVSSLAGLVLELVGQRKDGEEFPLELSLAVWGAGGHRYYSGVIRDVTQRRKEEQELRDHRENLQALVEARTRELDLARHTAEEATRAKSSFLANLSHDIRSPMNSIIGMTDLALHEATTPEQRQYLEIVMQSADGLMVLLNNVLDLSKIEAGRLELEQMDFSPLHSFEQACETMAIQAHRKNLELIYEVAPNLPVALVGDPTRLRQILVNLLANAIKFTVQGEVVVYVGFDEVPLTLEERQALPYPDPVRLHFTVADTGTGISPEQIHRIFEPFQQGDVAVSRRFGGTGLGLAISRQLAELMGGRLWVASREGEGSVFHFTACFGVVAAHPREILFTREVRFDVLKVLVMDGHPIARKVVVRTLSMCGARVIQVATGADALDHLLAAATVADPFDLILLDGCAPDIAFHEMKERLRGLVGGYRRLIFMFPTCYRPDDYPVGPELPMVGRLIKPINRSAMIRMINEAFGHGEEGGLLPPSPRWLRADQPYRLLLVEDYPANRQLASRILEQAGYLVTAVGEANSALACLARESFDLVLMDVQLPDMDGMEATRKIRSGAVQSRIAVVGVTALVIKEELDRCLAAGMNAYLTKPYRPVELLAIVQRWTHDRTQAEFQVTHPAVATCAPSPVWRPEWAGRLGEPLALLEQAVVGGDLGRIESQAGVVRNLAMELDAKWIKTAALRVMVAARSRDADQIRRYCQEMRQEWQRLTQKEKNDENPDCG